MKEQKLNIRLGGIGLIPLTIIFIVLKVTNTAAWSWFWVLSPLWLGPIIGISLVFGMFLFVFGIGLLAAIFDSRGY